jgi:hypothetical protein
MRKGLYGFLGWTVHFTPVKEKPAELEVAMYVNE